LTLRAGRPNGLPEARHDGTPAAMTMAALFCAPLPLLPALPAAAGPSPAATCAAFWPGWSDAAARLAVRPADPTDAAQGAAFRAAAA
jgi:hypothetical protein